MIMLMIHNKATDLRINQQFNIIGVNPNLIMRSQSHLIYYPCLKSLMNIPQDFYLLEVFEVFIRIKQK